MNTGNRLHCLGSGGMNSHSHQLPVQLVTREGGCLWPVAQEPSLCASTRARGRQGGRRGAPCKKTGGTLETPRADPVEQTSVVVQRLSFSAPPLFLSVCSLWWHEISSNSRAVADRHTSPWIPGRINGSCLGMHGLSICQINREKIESAVF